MINNEEVDVDNVLATWQAVLKIVEVEVLATMGIWVQVIDGMLLVIKLPVSYSLLLMDQL